MSPSENRARLVAPALLLAVVAISFAAIFFRQTAPTHPLVAAGLRLIIAATLLLPWVLRASRAGQMTRRVLGLGALAGVAYGVHFGSWVASLHMTSVAASVTLVTVTPLLLAVLSLVTRRDRPDRRRWLALGAAVIGVAVIGSHDFGVGAREGALAGDALALLGAAAMAGYLLIGRRLGSTVAVGAFSGIATAVGGVLLLGSAAAVGVPLEPASAEAFGYIALAALVPQLIGHNLLTWAVRHTTPTLVGTASLGEPVGAALLAWLWLSEPVTITVGIGCAITLAAVFLALWEPRRGR